MRPAPYCLRNTPRKPQPTGRANRAQHIHPLSTREEEGLDGPSSLKGAGEVESSRSGASLNRPHIHSEIFSVRPGFWGRGCAMGKRRAPLLRQKL